MFKIGYNLFSLWSLAMADTASIFIDSYLDLLCKKFYSDDPENKKNRNLAFEIFSIAVILDKPFDEVFNTIQINNDNDGGIDGIYLEQIDSSNYIQHIFQCKNISSLKKNSLNKFLDDYRKIFTEGNISNQQNAEGLKPFYDEYENLTYQRNIITPCLYFVFNGNKNDKNSLNKTLFDSYNKANEFEIFDKNDLYQKIAQIKGNRRKEVEFIFKPEKSNISFKDPQSIYSYAIGNIKAANFRISALELCNLIEKEKEINGTEQYLFETNIRTFLNLKAKPNKRMEETINNDLESSYFPFFNNGITMIADRLEIPTALQNNEYLVTVKNPEIVNGLQTSKVIQSFYEKDKDKLQGVTVNIRIYETDNKQLIDKITDATNTQTPINFKDKISNSKLLKNTQLLFNNNGINFIVKRGDQFNQDTGSDKLKKSVSSEIIIKFWYATFFECPEKAKNSISVILQEIYDSINTEDAPLSILFYDADNTPVYKQFLYTYRIYEYVQERKKTVTDLDFIPTADELLCYGIYCLNKSTISEIEKVSVLRESYDSVMTTIKEIISKMVKEYSDNNQAFSYNNFFKSPVCRIKYNEKVGITETSNLLNFLLTQK